MAIASRQRVWSRATRCTLVLASFGSWGCVPVAEYPAVCVPDESSYCVGPFVLAEREKESIISGARMALAVTADPAFTAMVAKARALITSMPSDSPYAGQKAFWLPTNSNYWAGPNDEPALAVATLVARGFTVGAASNTDSLFNPSTIAWEGAKEGPIILNRMRQQRSEQWANTFVHELSHRAGFHHEGNSAKGNECSVPYVVGWIAENLALVAAKKPAIPADCPPLEPLFGGPPTAAEATPVPPIP